MSRVSFVKTYTNVRLTTPTYPNCRIDAENPYDEQIMSMPTIVSESNLNLNTTDHVLSYRPGAYFFFIFNLTNYFHCLYDTLPYLVHYKELLKTQPDCTRSERSSERAMPPGEQSSPGGTISEVDSEIVTGMAES